MKVIVDTSVWSLALRRDGQNISAPVKELRSLVQDHRVQMIGPIRQEILSGIRKQAHFEKLRKHLNSFPDLPILTEDYVTAARFFNQCRANGVQGSSIDFLICSIAVRHKFPIFTTDKDFEQFSRFVPIKLHKKG
jgi:predicted nucleic acid-binding protein